MHMCTRADNEFAARVEEIPYFTGYILSRVNNSEVRNV